MPGQPPPGQLAAVAGMGCLGGGLLHAAGPWQRSMRGGPLKGAWRHLRVQSGDLVTFHHRCWCTLTSSCSLASPVNEEAFQIGEREYRENLHTVSDFVSTGLAR